MTDLTIYEAIDQIKFPINGYNVWYPIPHRGYSPGFIPNWDSLYKILEVNNRKEISIDFHPVTTWGCYAEEKRLSITLIVGNAGDLYMFNELCNENKYNEQGIKNEISFGVTRHPKFHVKAKISYILFGEK